MDQFINLDNLFHKPLIPIGSHDKAQLEEIYLPGDGEGERFTSWFVALLWDEEGARRGWKVIVFPTAEGRAFWHVPPLFYTSHPASYEQAWKLSEAIRLCSLKDRLTDKFVHPYWDNWDRLETIYEEEKGCST